MRLTVLLTALLPIHAQATQVPLSARELAIMKELTAIAAEAEADLPPCLGHERLAEASFRNEPPKTCAKARKIYEAEQAYDAKLRANCHEMTRWAEEQVRDPAPGSCAAALTKIMRLKDEMRAERDKADGEYPPGTDPDDPELRTGEYARAECAFPTLVMMITRQKQNGLANKNYGFADMAINDTCEDSSAREKVAEEFSQYLREGERVYREP